jgi:hypothetical protein
MPTISRIFGIAIVMFFDDHGFPHFYDRHAEGEAKVRIDNLEVMDSSLSRRQLQFRRQSPNRSGDRDRHLARRRRHALCAGPVWVVARVSHGRLITSSSRGDRINVAYQSDFVSPDITGVSRSRVDSAVSDLVDAQLPRLWRMALANCKQHKRRLRGLSVDAEHSSPAAIGLRNVVLDASAETTSVTRFGLARTQ